MRSTHDAIVLLYSSIGVGWFSLDKIIYDSIYNTILNTGGMLQYHDASYRDLHKLSTAQHPVIASSYNSKARPGNAMQSSYKLKQAHHRILKLLKNANAPSSQCPFVTMSLLLLFLLLLGDGCGTVGHSHSHQDCLPNKDDRSALRCLTFTLRSMKNEARCCV
jgi:hypothetical protein